MIFIVWLPLCVSQKGFDVFNALDLMENKVFLEKLKFGIGDGNLQYYLYNWKCPPMDPDKVSSMMSLSKQSIHSGVKINKERGSRPEIYVVDIIGSANSQY